jgi:hypothetical protein
VKLLGTEVLRRLLLVWLVFSFAGTALAAGIAASEPPPLAAKFSVSINAATPLQIWYLFRDAQRIALLKGDIEETWHRDAQGRISFERIFHQAHQAVHYSAGELAALRVDADWAALARFVDPQEFATLKPVARSGQGALARQRLQGQGAGKTLRVDWLPALQLPALIERRAKAGSTRIVLLEQAALAPAAWPRPGQGSADYLGFDAADFGDMPYEPVVRKSEAIDIRAGWRAAPGHD